MLRVVTVSSRCERENAERIAEVIRTGWPGIESSQNEHVTVAAGLKLVRESDLLVTFDLDRPRDGFQAGAIVIEVKRLDRSRLEAIGNDLRPLYANGPAKETVLGQLKDQITGICVQLDKYGRQRCYVHGLAWMLGASTAELREQAPGLSPFILGSDATWAEMLAAAAGEHRAIAEPKSEADRGAVAFVTKLLTRERRMSARDLAKLDSFTTEVLVRDVIDDVMPHVGREQVRLQGRAGSGKSTTLALLACRVVQRDGARILFLTYQRVLRGELEHLVRVIAGPSGVAADSIVVTTMLDLLIDMFTELGGQIPLTGEGTTDYPALPQVVAKFLDERGRETLASDAATLRELYPARFDFDYVFIDEGQDWRPSERDLLRLLFRPEATVIADGVDQFAQRQSRCDWTRDTPKPRYVRELKRSLRMSANVASFVMAFARALGYHDWSITPHPDLTGGRVILASQATFNESSFGRALAIGREAKVSPGDCLVAVPPSLVQTIDGGRAAKPASVLRACNVAVWDATDERTRLIARHPDEVAVVPYGSIRGLEGWETILLELDGWHANRVKHPNLETGDGVFADDVARRAMLLAVTRAAHVLIVTIGNPDSEVSTWLEEAAREVGPDIVERW